MLDFLFTGTSGYFGIPAVFGTLFFAVRLGMSLIGLDAEVDADADFGGDFGDAGGDYAASHDEAADHAESSTLFKFLSIQGILSFCMGFGWVGLYLHHSLDQNLAASAIVGILGGVGLAWVFLKILASIRRLESSGNVRATDAIGHEAVVDVTVLPDSNSGTVRVEIAGRLVHMPARSEAGEIARHTPVMITGMDGPRTYTVRPTGTA